MSHQRNGLKHAQQHEFYWYQSVSGPFGVAAVICTFTPIITSSQQYHKNSQTIWGLPEKPYSSLTGCPSKKINCPQIILSYNKQKNYKIQTLTLAHQEPQLAGSLLSTTQTCWHHTKRMPATDLDYMFWNFSTQHFKNKNARIRSCWTSILCDVGKLPSNQENNAVCKTIVQKTMGHFTFWLRPWLSFLAEHKTTLSRRWAKK